MLARLRICHICLRSAAAFNQDLSRWDVSKVTNMSDMFAGATAFNQDLSRWGSKTGNVTNMSDMFQEAIAFNLQSKRVGC